MNTKVSLPQKKPRKPLVSRKMPLENGLIKGSFLLSEPQVDNDSITLPNTSKTKTTNQKIPRKRVSKKSVTVESLPTVKKMTLNDKLNTCSHDTLTTESSQTLAPVSTSKDQVSEPYWNSRPNTWCQKLWLPTETDCADLHSNWLNGYFQPMESNSWFSIKTWNPLDKQNLQKISWQSSTFSIAESMAKENMKGKTRKNKLRKTDKPSPNISRKVPLKPTKEVANTLRQWFGCVRLTYNWALSCVKKKPEKHKFTNVTWMRKRFVNECNIPKNKSFLLDTPKHVRDTAIVDLCEAYTSNFKKKKEDPSHTFDINFRSKKQAQSITIPWDSIKLWDTKNDEFKMYPTYLKNKIKLALRKNKNVPATVNNDCKLCLDTLGRFYLVVPYYVSPCENQAGRVDRWCSIDPGVRTMLTIYSPTPGICYKIGDNDISRVFRLCKGLDKLVSLIQRTKNVKNMKSKKQKVLRLRKAEKRLRNRIRNLTTEVHCKTVKFLLTNFNKIIIPPFNVSSMVKKERRKITCKTVRQMLSWKHFCFRRRLMEASARRLDVEVFVRTEEYTSKTCTSCLKIKHDLGGAKIYKCKYCNLKGDRDVCGARNIFIKNISV